MALADDVAELQTVVEKVVADVDVPTVPSVGDQVLEAVLPVLTAAGYTVTTPTVPSDVSSDSTSADSTSTSVEA